jgi:IclR family transcriptional regulator, KDG regulon repressor
LPRRSSTDAEPLQGVQAVQLVLEILEHLAKQEVAGVTEIATALGSTKARVHRHLRTLVNAGYAVQEPGGERYCAGPRLVVLAQMLAIENSLTSVARPVMQRLRNALGHTVALAKITGARASMVDACEGSGLLSIAVRTGIDMPLHANAGGKLVLAFGEAEIQQSIDTMPLEKFTENTITDNETLKAEVERVRQQGWANAPEEFVIGINAIAAPIFDRENRLVATMALVNSIQFLGRRPTVEQIGAITAGAAEITRHLALRR